jgi:hypothetical protein
MCATYRAVPTKERVKDSGIKMRRGRNLLWSQTAVCQSVARWILLNFSIWKFNMDLQTSSLLKQIASVYKEC